MASPHGFDLVKLEGVTAPQPWMRPHVAEAYKKLRNRIAVEAGFDFLARCGDVYRDPGFTSKKDGVANRSWHKTGRVFDYDQTSKALVIVSEPKAGKQYFRTYLKCTKQDGTQGTLLSKKDIRGYTVKAYMVDFTAIADAFGFRRIPAWDGWQKSYNRREFWHYQLDEGLTWAAAMAQLSKAKVTPTKTNATPEPGTKLDAKTVIGLNDRGAAVREIQQRLVDLKFLAAKEVDGIFGAKTKAAIQKFQKANKLDADGLVGPLTRAKLFAK
jgi:hypothetical protein